MSDIKSLPVVVIGAGIAGLAIAIRQAARGERVIVYEANEGPGGKLTSFRLGGYRFDLGPSLFTMPGYVDELFELAGETPAAHFAYDRLDTVCRYFWEDGTRVAAFAEKEAFVREMADKLHVDATAVRGLLVDAERKYRLTGRTFLEKSLHRIATWLQPSVWRAMLLTPSLDLWRTMHEVHQRRLRNDKAVQLFDRFATYNGSNPYRAPGLLTMIPHFEHHYGAYLPQGGMYAITLSLYQLALRLGVTFNFNIRVDKIVVADRRATGVQVAGQCQVAKRVICNQDVFFAYRHLLADQPQPERILGQQKSTSAIIFYWGIRREFPELDVHNIFFSEQYREEFAALERGEILDDPTVYVNITAHRETGDAPDGCENWFVMINAPYDDGQDWKQLTRQTRIATLHKLNRMLAVDIESLIEEERILTPPQLATRTGSHLGALYGTSSNSSMAAFLRHPNFSNRIRDLYFCGGSVHPGGGIPLCLLSAKIVDENIR